MSTLRTHLVETCYGSVRVAERPARRSTAEPAVAFVHGYPDNLQIWSAVIGAMTTERRLVAFDWPGLGHSDIYQGGATPFHLGRHFVAVLDALGIDRVVPVGFDMGAHAVVAAAARAPDRVDRLVLMNFLADGRAATSWDIDVMRRLGFNRLVLRFGARVVFERARRTFLCDRELSGSVRRDLWAGFRRPEVRAHLRRMCVGYQAALPRVTQLYPSLDMPTLVLWADADPHFPLGQARAVSDALPRARLDVIESSHWAMWESPRVVAAAIDDFLASDASSAAP